MFRSFAKLAFRVTSGGVTAPRGAVPYAKCAVPSAASVRGLCTPYMDPDLLAIVSQAGVHTVFGRYAEAEAEYMKALQVYSKSPSAQGPLVHAQILLGLRDLHIKMGRYEDALVLAYQQADAYSAVMPSDSVNDVTRRVLAAELLHRGLSPVSADAAADAAGAAPASIAPPSPPPPAETLPASYGEVFADAACFYAQADHHGKAATYLRRAACCVPSPEGAAKPTRVLRQTVHLLATHATSPTLDPAVWKADVIPHLRAAVALLTARGSPPHVLSAVTMCLHDVFLACGAVEEAEPIDNGVLQHLLARYDASTSGTEMDAALFDMLTVVGVTAARFRKDFARAVPLLEQAVDLLRERRVKADPVAVHAYNALMWSLTSLNADARRLLPLQQECVTLTKRFCDKQPAEVVRALLNLAALLERTGDVAGEVKVLREAAAIVESDPRVIPWPTVFGLYVELLSGMPRVGVALDEQLAVGAKAFALLCSLNDSECAALVQETDAATVAALLYSRALSQHESTSTHHDYTAVLERVASLCRSAPGTGRHKEVFVEALSILVSRAELGNDAESTKALAVELLAHADAHVPSALLAQAEALRVLSTIAMNAKDWLEMERYARRYVEATASVHGPAAQAHGDAHLLLSIALAKLSKFAEALDVVKVAVSLYTGCGYSGSNLEAAKSNEAALRGLVGDNDANTHLSAIQAAFGSTQDDAAVQETMNELLTRLPASAAGVQARLQIGEGWVNRGVPSRATAVLQSAVEAQRQVYGAEDLHVVDTILRQASLLLRCGDVDAVLAALKAAHDVLALPEHENHLSAPNLWMVYYKLQGDALHETPEGRSAAYAAYCRAHSFVASHSCSPMPSLYQAVLRAVSKDGDDITVSPHTQEACSAAAQFFTEAEGPCSETSMFAVMMLKYCSVDPTVRLEAALDFAARLRMRDSSGKLLATPFLRKFDAGTALVFGRLLAANARFEDAVDVAHAYIETHRGAGKEAASCVSLLHAEFSDAVDPATGAVVAEADTVLINWIVQVTDLLSRYLGNDPFAALALARRASLHIQLHNTVAATTDLERAAALLDGARDDPFLQLEELRSEVALQLRALRDSSPASAPQ